MKAATQEQAILKLLQEQGNINPLQALKEVGCFRLAAHIHTLRKKGYTITSKRIVKNGRFGKVSFAEYHLIKNQD